MINLKEHRNTVVHCPTEELIMQVEDQIVLMGGRRLWDDNGKKYIIEYRKQPTGMCFGLDAVERYGNAYCDLEYYKKAKYNVITAQEFLRMCGKFVDEVINNYQIY
jgi:hypothetical protein